MFGTSFCCWPFPQHRNHLNRIFKYETLSIRVCSKLMICLLNKKKTSRLKGTVSCQNYVCTYAWLWSFRSVNLAAENNEVNIFKTNKMFIFFFCAFVLSCREKANAKKRVRKKNRTSAACHIHCSQLIIENMLCFFFIHTFLVFIRIEQ